jgi:hypothetical protein
VYFKKIGLDEVRFNECNLYNVDFKDDPSTEHIRLVRCNIHGTRFYPGSEPFPSRCIDVADFYAFKAAKNFIETPSQELKGGDLSKGVSQVLDMLAINPSIIMHIIANHSIIPARFLLDDLVEKMKQHNCLEQLEPLFDHCKEPLIKSCIGDRYDLERCLKSMPVYAEKLLKEIITNIGHIKRIFKDEENPEKVLNAMIKKYPTFSYLKVARLLHSQKTKRQIHHALIKLGIFQKNNKKESYRHVSSDESREEYHSVVRGLQKTRSIGSR